ncbi:MAG TPA: hypothetical protein VHA52_02590, partial [Candidatus Babeliaceae bacterium]|nr:hypothetical protein [Candidatus Babeliaceae bacterium]
LDPEAYSGIMIQDPPALAGRKCHTVISGRFTLSDQADLDWRHSYKYTGRFRRKKSGGRFRDFFYICSRSFR